MQPANKRIFTEEEIQYLKENYATTKNRILQERLGIGRTLLQMTARKFGLRKIPTFQSDFVKAAKKYNDGRAKNRPSQKAIDNSRATLKRLRQDSEYHARWCERISEGQKKLYRAERRRVMFGLEQKTNKKVVKAPKSKYELRYKLRKCGYIIARGSSVAYYNESTQRHAGKEESARKYGIKIEIWKEQ